MALIPIKVDRTSRPPAGTTLRSDGHWSVQGLRWGFTHGYFDTNGTAATLTGSPTVTDQGIFLNGTTQQLDFDKAINPRNNNFTAIVGIIPSGTPTTYTSLISTRATLNSGWAVRNSQLASPYLGFTSFGKSDYGGEIPSIPAGSYGVVGVSVSGGYATLFDGTGRSQLISIETPPDASDLTGFSLGASKKGVLSDFFDGRVLWALYYDRPLSRQEWIGITQNPWQIFEPEVIWHRVSTLNQYSYRFLNDDGSESTATFAGDINTAVTLSPGDIRRLRILIDATGDPTGKRFQLEYRKKPSGGSFGPWTEVT